MIAGTIGERRISALNDIVIARNGPLQLLYLKVSVNDQELAVYRADVSGAEDKEALRQELWGLSKSKAAARQELTRLFDETVVLTENAREPEKGGGAP